MGHHQTDAASLKTEVVLPDLQDSVSGFFRVVAPSFILVATTVWIRTYYAMNVKDIPWFYDIPLLLLCVIGVVYCFSKWYHGLYQKRGKLVLSPDTIDFEWNTTGSEFHFKTDEIENVAVTYDGYPTPLGNSKGTENQLRFTSNKGEDFSINFLLADEDAANNLEKVLKAWYDKGMEIIEFGAEEGDERYLLRYPARYKTNPPVPQVEVA